MPFGRTVSDPQGQWTGGRTGYGADELAGSACGKAFMQFNEFVYSDSRVDVTVLPLFDGISQIKWKQSKSSAIADDVTGGNGVHHGNGSANENGNGTTNGHN